MRRVALFVVLSVLASLLASQAPASADPWSITLTVNDSSLKTGESATLTATANQSVSGTQQIKIYRADGSHQKSCSYASVCTLTISYSTTPRTYIAYVAGQGAASPPPDIVATSETVTVSPEPWILTLSTDKTVLSTGEAATVTATANQNATSTLNILIYNNVTGQHVKSCSVALTCSFTTSVGVAPRSFRAYAAPWASQAPPAGAMGSSNIVYVTRAPWSVALAPDQQGVLTATVSQSVSGGPYLTQIYDTTTNTRIKSCSTGTVCQASSWNSQHEYVAYVGSTSTTAPPAVYAAVSTGWGDVEGLSIDQLTIALAAFPLSELCLYVGAAPGTNVPNSSLNAEAAICAEASMAGKTVAQFLADLAAAGYGTAVVWWTLHQLTGPEGTILAPDLAPEPNPLGAGTSLPPATLPPVWGIDDLVIDVMELELNSGNDEASVRVGMISCVWYVSAAPSFGSDPAQDCRTRPIFLSGSDVASATTHDIEALTGNAAWAQLNYERGATKPGQGWYSSLYPCVTPAPSGMSCDEYPFFASEQGGGASTPLPSLKYIDSAENSRQGGKYGNFVVACHLATGTPGPSGLSTGGDAFLAIPISPSLNIETFRLCNEGGTG